MESSAAFRALVTVLVSAVALASPAVASASTPAPSSTSIENWSGPSTSFHPATEFTRMAVVASPGATDGTALRLQLGARPSPGASGSSIIASNRPYRYGRFGTRMKTADCTGQDHPGVITGFFTYSTDHADANHNGLSDNDEIDIEFLCGQPDVVYLSLWTDYNETGNALREITRTINLRTGTVLSTCSIVSYGSGCQPLLAGENSPLDVPAIAGFNSAKQFHGYAFDWQPGRVVFSATDTAGHPVVLWDYRGPRSRIPAKPSILMQNVTYTKVWNPLNGPAHNQPTARTSAYLDSTFTPN